PPRCWGVGLSRTGNTSFCAALSVLGYRRVQQDAAFEMLGTLDGGSGNTLVLHFKYLDYMSPGSKFVLMTRTLEGWLASMERSQRLNQWPIVGEHERVARRMAIYETVGYDADVLAAAFRRHHADVRRYFAGRPDALLELDIAGGEGWDRLCPFLGLAPPNARFPALNHGWAK
ncbi:sulfotransferase, partial [Phenylobacterium sp.]|uniref:sulfotransferase n=1 Tax=Phenylobacterium sp. TaxID=1871053 RepID=UPI0027334C22